MTIWFGAAAISAQQQAPFHNNAALRVFSDSLITQFSKGSAGEALAEARANSHLDDPVVQANLDSYDVRLPLLLELFSQPSVATFLEKNTFGRSFIRHSYELRSGDKGLRCMFTYRRKTDGWRLNQIWCE